MSAFIGTVLFILILSVSNGQEEPTVEVAEGSLRGIKMQSTKGQEFYAFLGVPYGEPPVGELRFKDTVPKKPWSGVYDATKDAECCASHTLDSDGFVGEEDCLYLNIYTHKLSTDDSNVCNPVFVFIHGGGFVLGTASSKMYPPQRFMNKNIVVVVPQYRLGALGFLNTRDENAPGNAGLIDQATALRWVQKNIAAFGGCPNQVTIGGQSAGAASVSYHYISPMSKGLFHSAIMQSGSSMGFWAIENNSLARARELGLVLQCPVANTTILVRCLQSLSARDIVTQRMPISSIIWNFMSFVPSIETRKEGAFLNANPRTLFAFGKFNPVPVMTGVTSEEMSIIFGTNYLKNLIIKENTFPDQENEIFIQSYPRLVDDLVNQNISNALAQLPADSTGNDFFKLLNLGWLPVQILSESLYNILSDMFFNAPNDLQLRYIAKRNAPTYAYVLDYAVEHAPLVGQKKIVPHMADLYLLFHYSNLRGKDAEMSDTLIELFTNFITHKNPTPNSSPIKWKEARDDLAPSYLHIGQTSITNKKGFRSAEAFVWNHNIFPILNPILK